MGCGWGAQERPTGQSKPGRNCFFSAVVGTVGTVLALGEEHCLQKGGRSLLIGCIKIPSAPSQSWLQVVALSSAVHGVPQLGWSCVLLPLGHGTVCAVWSMQEHSSGLCCGSSGAGQASLPGASPYSAFCKRPGWSQDQAPITIWGGGDITWSCCLSWHFLVQILCSHPRWAGNRAETAIVPYLAPIIYFKGLSPHTSF